MRLDVKYKYMHATIHTVIDVQLEFAWHPMIHILLPQEIVIVNTTQQYTNPLKNKATCRFHQGTALLYAFMWWWGTNKGSASSVLTIFAAMFGGGEFSFTSKIHIVSKISPVTRIHTFLIATFIPVTGKVGSTLSWIFVTLCSDHPPAPLGRYTWKS